MFINLKIHLFRLWIQGDMVDRKIEDIDQRLTFVSKGDIDSTKGNHGMFPFTNESENDPKFNSQKEVSTGQTQKIILNEKSNIEYTQIKNMKYTESMPSKHVLETRKILSQTEDKFKINYQRRTQKMMLPWKMHLASPMMRGK